MTRISCSDVPLTYSLLWYAGECSAIFRRKLISHRSDFIPRHLYTRSYRAGSNEPEMKVWLIVVREVRKMRPCLKASHGLSSVYSLRERGHSWSNIPSNVVEGDNERSAHNERCPRISDEEQPSCKRHRILCVGDTENEKTSGKNDNAHYHSAKWSAVPTEALVHVFSKLSMKDIGRSAQVCRSWHQASQFAELWQHFEFVIGDTDVSHPQPTSPGLIDHVIAHHSKHLKFVVFKTDTSSESTRTACRILSRLVDCPLRTLALVSSSNSKPFVGVDYTSFASAVTTMLNKSSHLLQSLAIDAAPVDDLSLQALASSCSPRSLHLLQMKDCSRVTKQGILTIAGHCNHLRELSLSWTLLSESLIYALSSKEHTHLEYLRVDMCTSHRSCPVVDNSASSQKWKPPSADCWRALINHSPDLALVINVFDGDDAWSASPEYESSYAIQNALSPQPCNFFSSYVPVTHLYFGSVAPKSVLASIAHHCPRLQELVAAGIECGNCEGGDWTGSLLDAELLAIADGCPQLSAIGLGDCEISCKALVEFAGRVGPRLSRLCVNEDSLVEEDEINIEMTSRLVSGLIGQEWNPESVPLW
ncbi:F-box/LRR-repeat protein 3-like isoform X2 [Ischnura elegans]|uniref:F-box/LRR-repeat protein 3-like isoform X2 n=1 Tax=Ischnura elegans TaxID=197161 RepID=UPI001ED8A6AA|nr:F-box/LRR-repeat protein 3-like isoform X2 [Ischnura elegans]